MKRPAVSLLPAALFWILADGPAYAWGNKGHQIVAYIAETHLTDAAKEKVKKLLPKDGTLAQASTWPDRIRKAVPVLSPLHYVDVPRGSNYYDPGRDLSRAQLRCRSHQLVCERAQVQ